MHFRTFGKYRFIFLLLNWNKIKRKHHMIRLNLTILTSGCCKEIRWQKPAVICFPLTVPLFILILLQWIVQDSFCFLAELTCEALSGNTKALIWLGPCFTQVSCFNQSLYNKWEGWIRMIWDNFWFSLKGNFIFIINAQMNFMENSYFHNKMIVIKFDSGDWRDSTKW